MLGLLELRRRRLQFALIGLIVTLISYLVAMINGLGLGLNELAGSALRNFNADAIAYSDTAGLSVIRSELSQETIDAILATSGVREGAPLGYVAANIRTADGVIDSAAFLGFDPGSIAEPRVVEGRSLAPGESGAMLADRAFLRVSGYRLGDSVPVSLRLQTREFRIVGVVEEGYFFFQPAVYISRTDWRSLRYGEAASAPQASIVLLKGRGLPGMRGRGYEIVDKDTAFANIEGVAGQQSTVSALRAFGYLIGSLVVGVFFYVLTLQKVPNIGVLKALGASNGYVFRQLIVQVLTISVAAVAIALPLAVLTGSAIQRLPDPVPIAFNTRTVVTTAVLLLTASLVGAAFSLRRILGTDPIIALGQQQ
ncbi:putative ABC transporter permease [bacterium HR29]|mgnify:CR=1 FL=1|jgi:putative ABC transport system permease protein|nr:putative ABC transporter permease [bacterium HR29]